MPEQPRPPEDPEERESAPRLFARFRAEHPDGDTSAFRSWLHAGAGRQDEEVVDAWIEDVLGRLNESDESEPSLFAPRGAASPPSSTGPASFEPGQRIGGHGLVRFLAAGGMGQVWEAVDEELGRTVALKLLHPGLIEPRTLDRFAREARAGGRLRHPSLVLTFGHGRSDEVAWIAQELVEGGRTLKDEIEEARGRSEVPRGWYRHVAERIAAVADGLEAAHRAGVIHRDVKPANVLIAPDGTPRLTDFGLARLSDETALSRTGDLAGTWAYMSPEQVRARRGALDRRTDVFSLGVVLYELLTLRRPFDGDSVRRTAEQILTLDPPEPARLRSGCPRDLSLICMRAIEKRRGDRYPSAAALADDLRRHLADEPIVARPPTRVERMRRWTRRHPVVSTAAAVGLIALAAISVLLARKLGDERELARLAATRAAEARAAEAERADLVRLSAEARLDELIARQRDLWPAAPRRLPELRRWIADAEELVAELPSHHDRLAALRRGSTRFDDDETRWWERRLAALTGRLEALADGLLASDASVPAHGWSVPKRVAFAERLAAGLEPGGELDRAWRKARAPLGAAHPDLELDPERWGGLLPLGADPESGLWEFAHLASGEPAVRDADGGLVLTPSTGIVLVLVPGGTFWMGSQSDDPDEPNHEPNPLPWTPNRPLRRVTLSPYLIAKHELTQGQWLALTGANPSQLAAGEEGRTLLNPVEGVSWQEARTVLERFGLTLPTEARWEHACRAGTQTPFAFGGDADVRGKINVADRTASEAGAPFAFQWDWEEHDDGAVHHAPVGSYPPNAFGLHEMHGNVYEICLDAERWGEYRDDESSADPLIRAVGDGNRIVRGGCYAIPAAGCRSYVRTSMASTAYGGKTGVRAARSLPEGGGR